MKPRELKPRRLLLPFVVALVVLAVALWFVVGLPLRQARVAWHDGRTAQAIAIAERWSALHLRASEYHEVLAAAYLTARNPAAAKPHLDALTGRTAWLSAVPKDEVARRLFALAAYDDFLAYDAAVHERHEHPDVALYRAAALASLGRTDEADAAFRAVDAAHVDQHRYAALRNAIAQRKEGHVAWAFDRTGAPIATIAVAGNAVQETRREVAPLVATLAQHATSLGTTATYETTLDPNVQRAAIAALGDYHGSLVAIDPRTNELLAVASTLPGDAPFDKQYEPGSVVKILTGLNAYESHIDLGAMFPYDCKGDLLIDGRHFGDWVGTGHGKLETLDEALAVSCNIVFADLGLRLGTERLRAFMTRAGFDQETNVGGMTVPLGRTVPPIFNRYETAFYAIGLEHESITALHLGMIATMMANRGVLAPPKLLLARHTILGDALPVPAQPAPVRLASEASANAMIRAMQAVATDPRGTGRRAPVQGMTLAMKTGTAGKRETNFQALICAFAPVEQPKIAFAIIVEGAGPAEFAGAKVAHDFLAALAGRS